MNANTEREIEEYVRRQNEDRKKKGLEAMLKDLNETIDRTNKTLSSFSKLPGEK